jgi:hypothetical protein
MGPVTRHGIRGTTRNRSNWRFFAFLGIITLVEFAVDDSTTATIIFDSADTTAGKHPLETRCYHFGYSDDFVVFIHTLKECRNFLHVKCSLL